MALNGFMYGNVRLLDNHNYEFDEDGLIFVKRLLSDNDLIYQKEFGEIEDFVDLNAELLNLKINKKIKSFNCHYESGEDY